MKPILRNFFLLSSLASGLHGQSISINFGAGEANGAINNASALTAGAIPVAGTFWNNMVGATQPDGLPLVDSTGAVTGATVAWSSPNIWRSGSPGGTASSQNGFLTKGYLDDGGAGNSVTVSNIPYVSYDVYVIRGSDQGGGTNNAAANYRPVTINGVAYQGNEPMGTVSTSTIPGNASTTGWNWTTDDVLENGRNYHVAPNQAGAILTVRGGTGTGRGPIAGIQIENAYTGTMLYWDLNGATAGAGGATPSGTWNGTATNWNNAAGTGTPTAWSGSASVANFAAGSDATGSYTVTIDGTRTADAVMLHRGNLTLTGGTLNLVNARLLRALGAGSTLRVDSAITSDGALVAEGAGAVIIGGTASHAGPTLLTGTSFTLEATGNLSGTSALEIATNTTAILKGDANISGNVSLSGSTVYLSDEASLNVGGNINLNNLGASQVLSLNDSASITATSPGAGQLFFNRGEINLNNSSSLTTRVFYNQTGGLTTTLNVADDATFTATEFMVLGDATSAAMVVNQTGGTVNSLGSTDNPSGNSMTNRWGHWGSNATVTYNLSGGELNMPNAPLYLSWDSGATLNISGSGTANLKGINMGYGTRENPSIINVDAGGTLNIGSAGIITGGQANKTINLNGGTLGATATWTGTVPVNLVSDSTIDTSGGSIALLGGISGDGGLVLEGGGTMAIGGMVSYLGPTTVNSGGGLGAGGLSNPGVGFLDYVVLNNGSTSTFRVSDSASDFLDLLGLTVNGTHTLSVLPAGPMAPGTVVDLISSLEINGTGGAAGINVVSGSPRLAVTKLPVSGGTLSIRVDSVDTLIWKGNHATTPNLWNNSAQNFLTSTTNQATAFLPDDLVLFDDSAATGDVTVAGTIAPGSLVFDNSTLAYTLSGDGISGPTGLTKRGSASLQINNTNHYTGVTRIEDGILKVAPTGALPTGGVVEVTGGELQLDLPDGSTWDHQTLIEDGGLVSLVGTGNLTITGPILGGGGDLYFDRDGTVLLNGPSAATGSVTVNRGTLAVDGGQVQNRLTANTQVVLNPGTTFEYRGVNATPAAGNAIDLVATQATIRVISGGSPVIGATGDSHAHLRNLTLNDSTIELAYSGAGTAYSTESFQLNGTISVIGSSPSFIELGTGATAANSGVALIGNRIFDVADVTSSPEPDLIVNAEVEDHDNGGGVLTKQGAGTLVLNAINTYTGGNEILGGTVAVTTLSDGPSSVGSGYLAVKNGATLQYNGTGEETTSRFLWLDQGTAILDITQPSASLRFVPGDGRVTQPVIKRGPGSLTLEIPLSGDASVSVEAGTLVLPSVNTYSGSAVVSGGTLVVSGASLPDDSRLSISGAGKVQVTAPETVNTLVIGGVPMAAGTYGATGSGAANIDDTRFSGTSPLTVLSGGSGDSFATWIDGFFPGVTDPAIVGSNADPDHDGIPNAVEMVIGNQPNQSSRANLPSSELVTNPTGLPAGQYLRFSYRRSQLSVDSNVGATAQYGTNLINWTAAANGTAGVTVIETADAGIPGHRVDVYIPRALAANGKLFGRLQVTVP
jgi:fibronectin-binding autotransporter adhesin